jgi:hypothetical protein
MNNSIQLNNQGTKFNLVVAIIIQGENDLQPKVVQARISPSIFVDSRKSARETQTIKVNAYNLI